MLQALASSFSFPKSTSSMTLPVSSPSTHSLRGGDDRPPPPGGVGAPPPPVSARDATAGGGRGGTAAQAGGGTGEGPGGLQRPPITAEQVEQRLMEMSR